MLVGEGFRLQGYQVVETGGGGADGGVDLVLKAGIDRLPTRAAAADAPAVPPNPAPMQAASCPLCSKPMVRRTAKRGVNAGSEFWGCKGYPACRGTRPIA